MQELVSTETLSYYLTKEGFSKFKEWYKSIDLFTDIYNELDYLTTIIENSIWLEDNLRKEIFEKIKTVIIKHITYKLGKDPEYIYNEWVNSIQKYCFQGGMCYKIQYSGSIPHHWGVKPEYYYNIVSTITKEVLFCCIITDKYINLSNVCKHEQWLN